MENKPLKANYHSHTFRCGHAEGTDEEFVRAAIENGYEIYGVTDHVMIPNHPQMGMRGTYEVYAQNYFDSIRALKEKYKSKIELHLGFEAEWLEDVTAEYYHDLLSKGIVEYLLLGQHCFLDSSNHWVWYRDIYDTKEATRLYLKNLIEGMKSGDFLYVAHPDFYMMWYGKWDDFAKEIAHEIINTAKDLHMILEVNMGPSRWGKKNYIGQELRVPYPDEDFWNVVAEADIPCVIGVDNHRPYELKTSPYDWVRSFVSRHQLRWLETIDIPSRKTK
jgi:histidinol-phosphatase (PHP family)